MLAHLRTEAYPMYQKHIYPPKIDGVEDELTYERNNELIEAAKKEFWLERKRLACTKWGFRSERAFIISKLQIINRRVRVWSERSQASRDAVSVGIALIKKELNYMMKPTFLITFFAPILLLQCCNGRNKTRINAQLFPQINETAKGKFSFSLRKIHFARRAQRKRLRLHARTERQKIDVV